MTQEGWITLGTLFAFISAYVSFRWWCNIKIRSFPEHERESLRAYISIDDYWNALQVIFAACLSSVVYMVVGPDGLMYRIVFYVNVITSIVGIGFMIWIVWSTAKYFKMFKLFGSLSQSAQTNDDAERGDNQRPRIENK